MAVASSAATATATITPPTSSHGENNHWGYNKYNPRSQDDDEYTEYTHQNGHSVHGTSSHRDGGTRKTTSADNLVGARWDQQTDFNALSPPLDTEPKTGRSYSMDSGARPHHDGEDQQQGAPRGAGSDQDDDHSKWIHRDKLAKIESEELQAAGIFIPKTRASSKQRRDRSQSRLRRGTDASEQSHNRSRKNSLAVEQRNLEISPPIWDLRTPEEIAEEESTDAYFTQNGGKGASRIPVAKTSPAPIPADYLERANLAARKLPDDPEDETILYPKTRSRSVSASVRDADANDMAATSRHPGLDASPRKNTTSSRKPSGTKPGTGRPKTGTGKGRDASNGSGTRPSTRSGDLSGAKQPEGDPPWMVNSYKPDPRLPPDQQLLPTVARRLQQEQWEKEGKFGNIYDKDFRPLNDNVFLKPPEAEKRASEENQENEHSQQDGWPLKPEAAAKSPSLRQGSYSTMPKIADKSPLSSPMASPRMPNTPQQFQSPQQPKLQAQATPATPAAQDPQNEKQDKDGGCGCCVVM
ncbi:hypothetical protein S40285_00013 [Stachybotrys chlorohalonatus IBT 40285]|uniref:TeaA receptor TeaR n=1 Tax=Stachybotrys chlorohalonatus (strain IBT 40285) TaxID=1283841 RepID=A0A084QYS7_STAC4|nr:hypothetical protein S40285_00013 [Stachybotrys chlorohalonata IBT 40285]